MASEVNLVTFHFLTLLGLKVPNLCVILLCLKRLPKANLSTRLAPRCLKVGRKNRTSQNEFKTSELSSLFFLIFMSASVSVGSANEPPVDAVLLSEHRLNVVKDALRVIWKNTKHQKFLSNLKRAVNRQPGYRPGDS